MDPSELLLNSNRGLATALLEEKVVSADALKAAQELLADPGRASHQASLLQILVYDMKALSEEALIEHSMKKPKVGLIDLHHLALALPENLDLAFCEATHAIPYAGDRYGCFIATTYYLSKPVRDYWESQIEEQILWFATSMASLADAFDRIRQEASKEAAVSA